jgi:hypothetical protein
MKKLTAGWKAHLVAEGCPGSDRPPLRGIAQNVSAPSESKRSASKSANAGNRMKTGNEANFNLNAPDPVSVMEETSPSPTVSPSKHRFSFFRRNK